MGKKGISSLFREQKVVSKMLRIGNLIFRQKDAELNRKERSDPEMGEKENRISEKEENTV